MPNAITTRRMMRAIPVALCFALAACASGNYGVMLLADPGKYAFFSCKQLADARKASVTRQAELKSLIERAEQGTGGALVGALAYRSEYLAAGENIEAIDQTAREKSCEQPSAPPSWRSNNAVQ